ATSTSMLPTKNYAGSIGNEIAGFLIFYLGIVSFALPIVLIQLSIMLRKAILKETLLPVLMGWLMLLSTLMPILNSIRPTVPIDTMSFSSGGAIGYIASLWCVKNLGATGSQILLWALLLSAIVLITRLGFIDLWRTIWPRKESTENSPSSTSSDPQEVQKTKFEVPSSVVTSPPVADQEQSLFEGLFAKAPLQEKIDGLFSKKPPSDENISNLSAPTSNEDILEEFGTDFAPKIPYTPPSLDIFKRTDERLLVGLSQKELEATSQVLIKTLEDFGVTGKIIGWQPGPVVTVYEYQPDAGVKQSKIIGLLDDIALSLKVDSIFIHPVSGKRALGIQVPNSRRDSVLLGDVLVSDVFSKSPSPLTFAMGKTINGTPYCADVTTMPHLLAAGATGTGKSVAINSLLCSIIMKSSPDDVRMILVDPKMLELSVYDGIPHLLMPVITEPDRASVALKWAANEMERRYKLMQHAQVRNIGGFNSFWDASNDEKKAQLRGLMGDESIQRLPYILLVIDELADLMLTAPKDVESSIQRLAQKARASGIHMVLATQRPSVDVITGVIKANLPCRLSFQVVSKHDSRTILDQVGSEKLLGKGDILLQRPGIGKLERLQGALVTDEEVLALVASAKSNYKSTYDERAMGWIDEEVTKSIASEGNADDISALVDGDPKWDEAINIAKTHGVVSASFLQRHLKIGYNRAARIVEAMEAQGLVAKADGAKPRKWLGSIG
ncbi:MAG: DNA translocase FtsK 4TM domain-containing protein, partial [Proteobacteria bacterium]|nr:DNA translocase FtsK 4TM domain-containing protein [Pseudomonadota bacterium]